MKDGIDSYTGEWVSDDGLSLDIVKIDETHASVTLLGPDGEPVCRPYWENKLTVEMPAEYDDYMGDFIVDLWEPHRGYTLELDHHRSDRSVDLDQEVLSPSISQYEKDSDLNQFHHLLGKLSDFKRRERKNKRFHYITDTC